MSSLQVLDLDCLGEKLEVEKAIKRECPEVTNAPISITSVDARVQKLAVVKVPELLAQLAAEVKIYLVLISEQYRNRDPASWHLDLLGTAAIWVQDDV